MTALSALNTLHKTGLFGNYQNKNKSELTTVSETKDIKIIQIVHYGKSTVKISLLSDTTIQLLGPFQRILVSLFEFTCIASSGNLKLSKFIEEIFTVDLP